MPAVFCASADVNPLAPPAALGEPRAAYLHVPFCAHRCGYCNFTLVAGRDDLVPRYLEALEAELALAGAPRSVETLFIGGGTPTHLAPRQLRRLLDLAARWHPLETGGELSVEANPSDLGPERCAALAAGGVTRVSLGAQSFSPRKLRLLERDHRAADIEQAARGVRAAGASLSLDLIFGAPGETLAEWRDDLSAALALEPDHLSIYGLTIERGTAFFARRLRGELACIDEDLERTLYLAAIDALVAAGFEHYEVSNFARSEHRCRHNEVYWAGRPYYAAGPGAARYVAGRREVNHRSPFTWMQRIAAGRTPVAECEVLAPEDRAREALVLGLRRMRGVERAAFGREFGYEVDELGGTALERFVAEGWLADHGDRLALTRAGLLVSDALWPALLRV